MKSYAQMAAVPRTEEYIGTGDTAIYRTVEKMKNIITQSSKNTYVREWAKDVVSRVEVNNKKGEAQAIFNFVRDSVRYTKDPLGFEYLQTPPTLLEDIRLYQEGKGERPAGDCVSGDTEIILRDKQTQMYVLKNIDELEYCYNQYEALSYDLNNEEWVFKDIVAWQDRGVKELHKFKFYNGTSEYCTLGHKVFNAKVTGGKLREISIKRFDEIDISTMLNSTKTNYNRVLCAKKIPSLDISVNKSEQELWIDGMYVAEGHCELDENGNFSRVSIAQDKVNIVEKLVEAVATIGIAGSWSKRTRNQYFRVCAEDSKRFHGMGRLSQNIQFLDEHLSLSENQLQSVLRGYFDGDGSYNSEGVEFCTTTSKKLAKQLAFMHLVLGKPLYTCDYGRPLSKFGNYPITRLYKFNSDRAYRLEVMKGVALVGPKSAEFVGHKRVYDITVKDTHNFVSSTGMIFHNCDDMCVLSLSLLKSIGFETAIKVVSFVPSKKYGHVYGLVKIGYDWISIDCVRPDQEMGWESKGHTRVMEAMI